MRRAPRRVAVATGPREVDRLWRNVVALARAIGPSLTGIAAGDVAAVRLGGNFLDALIDDARALRGLLVAADTEVPRAVPRRRLPRRRLSR